jgi:hypothetical protein
VGNLGASTLIITLFILLNMSIYNKKVIIQIYLNCYKVVINFVGKVQKIQGLWCILKIYKEKNIL